MTSSTPSPTRAEQPLDLQVVGPDALQRRQRAHQHVIDALELARLLDRRHVLRLLDDADDPAVAVASLLQNAHGSTSVMLLQTEQ